MKAVLLVESIHLAHRGQKRNAPAEMLWFALYRSERRMFPSVAGFLAGTEMEELAKKKKNQVHLLRISPEFMQCTVWQFMQCTVMLQRGMEVVSEL